MFDQFIIRNFVRILIIILLFGSNVLCAQSIVKYTYSSFYQQGSNDTVHLVAGQSMDNFTDSPKAFIGFLPTQYSLLSNIEIETKLVTFYPNPVLSILYCDLTAILTEDNIDVRVVSLDGKVKLSQKSVNTSFILDIEYFESGIYFLEIYMNEEIVSTNKLVKI